MMVDVTSFSFMCETCRHLRTVNNVRLDNSLELIQVPCPSCGIPATVDTKLVLEARPSTTPPGVKFDHGKPRWDLLPFEALNDVVAVLSHGASKYAPNNWRHVKGARWRYFRAGMGHMTAWWMGHKMDDGKDGSGLPHIAHAICCFLFLLALDRDGKLEKLDDEQGE